MLTIYRSNRAEWLAKLLSEQLYRSPPGICETCEIAVNTWPTSRWLGEQIAFENGINALIRFPFPGNYFRKIVEIILGLEVSHEDPWLPKNLSWVVLDSLPELLSKKEAIYLKDWLANKSKIPSHLDKNKWELVKCIANTINDYVLYRPELINQWWNSQEKVSYSTQELSPNLQWQPSLIELIKKRVDYEPFSVQVKRVIRYIKDKNVAPENLPKTIRFFGVSSLAPIQIEFLQAISAISQVEIFLLTPCKDLWTRSIPGEEQLSQAHGTSTSKNWVLKTPRLEASLGRMNSEFQQLLEGSGEYQLGEWNERDLFAMPATIAYNLNTRPSLLEQLQQKLIDDDDKKLKRELDDDSILFYECPGRRRQVQIVRDQIIQWLANNETLEPRDIIIMTPQIELFSPLITSVFNDISATGVELPWKITDRSQQNKPGLIQYILELLEIASKKLTATCLDNLLNYTLVQKNHGLSQREVDKLSRCLQETGFRSYIYSNPGSNKDTHTLNWCLDRWLLGIIYPSKDGIAIGEIAPYSKNITIDEITRWWELLANLGHQLNELSKAKTPDEWLTLLREIIEASSNENAEFEWEKQFLLSVLEEWRKEAESCKLKLESNVVVCILKELIEKESGRFGHRSGKITISALEPMRAIPHKVIILMGLDENIFPRTNIRPGFNLLEHKRKLGDPSISDKDRYTLLEGIMSARKHLLLSWNSRNEKTGESLEPSSPVSQFYEYLKSEIVDVNSIEGLRREHSANPLSDQNFVSKNGQPPISCDRRNLEAKQWLNKGCYTKSIALGLPLKWETNHKNRSSNLSYEDLKDWLIAPQIFWLKHLQLKLHERISPIQDQEDLTLGELTRYKLLNKHFQAITDIGFEQTKDIQYLERIDWETIYNGQGILPPKTAGLIESELLEKRWHSLLKTLSQLGHIEKKQLRLDNGLYELVVAGEYVVVIEIGKLKAKTILSGWLAHLIACSFEKIERKTLLVSRNDSLTKKDSYSVSLNWDPIPKIRANELLQELLGNAENGKEQCWPVPPISGWQFANAKGKNHSKSQEFFIKSWNGQFKKDGECKKAEMQLCFGYDCNAEVFLSSEGFHNGLEILYKPIIEYMN